VKKSVYQSKRIKHETYLMRVGLFFNFSDTNIFTWLCSWLRWREI